MDNDHSRYLDQLRRYSVANVHQQNLMLKPCTFIVSNLLIMVVCALYSQEYQIFNISQSVPRDFLDRDDPITKTAEQVQSSYLFFSHHLDNYDQ